MGKKILLDWLNINLFKKLYNDFKLLYLSLRGVSSCRTPGIMSEDQIGLAL